MNFEHLVQVNDPLDPFSDALSRQQLWDGLVLRAEQPQLFVEALDHCTIVARTKSTLERELHYGQTTVRDRVTLVPATQVRYEIPATAEHVGGSLTMTIEEPDALRMFVRFEYRTTLPEAGDPGGRDGDAEQTREIVKSAYREADIDTVRVIRELVRAGRLSRHLH